MADIFISYSSKDRKQAMTLVKRLQASGFEVWIDKQDIEGAAAWSGEIVQAIEHCKIVIILISHAGLSSDNVSKEVSLASAKHKKLVPVTLEHITLTDELQYHLAGIQHIAYKEYDRIEKAIHRLLSPGQSPILTLAPDRPRKRRAIIATIIVVIILVFSYTSFFSEKTSQTPSKQPTAASGEITRLAVLHLDDLSPARDKSWLADGIMDKLINTLGAIEDVYVVPRINVLSYNTENVRPDQLAAALKVRYILTGSVQDSGKTIRVILSLYDADNLASVWSKQYAGTFQEIFTIEQRITRSLIEGLRLHISPKDEKILRHTETDSPEAYELYLKGLAYYRKHTRSDYERSIELREEALKLDPSFVLAHLGIANTCQEYYYRFSRDAKLLKRAEQHMSVASSLEGETPRIYQLRSIIALRSGDEQQVFQLAQ